MKVSRKPTVPCLGTWCHSDWYFVFIYNLTLKSLITLCHIYRAYNLTPQYSILDVFTYTSESNCNCMPPHSLRNWTVSQSQSHIATDGQSVTKSWCQAPSGTQIFSYYYLTVTVLFLWGALSDEKTGLSFVYAAGSSQRSLSRVRVPWYSRPYFTVSDLRLPFCHLLRLAGSQWRYSTPPPHGLLSTHHHWTVESQSHIATDSQSVSQSVSQ
jgi:hypothetical protein